MDTYRYTAKDKNSHTVIGILDGTSETEVADILHKKELVVVSIEPAKKRILKTRDKKIKLDDLVIFTRQLATMIDSGVPLVQSLGILAEQIENKNLKEVVIRVRQDIEAGMNFYDALAKHPNVFSELFINMTKAGEASGTLNEVLDRLATSAQNSYLALKRFQKCVILFL